MNDIIRQYTKVSKAFSELRNEIENDISQSNYCNSLKALLNCTEKIDELGKIVQLDDINFYSSQTITRVVFEHYLVSDYIYTRSKNEKTDKVGEEYYKHYLCGEFFKRKSYATHVDEFAQNAKRKRSQLEIIQESFDEFKELEEKDLSEINHIMNSFSNLKKIGEYLIKTNMEDTIMRDFSITKLDLIKRYSDLSS